MINTKDFELAVVLHNLNDKINSFFTVSTDDNVAFRKARDELSEARYMANQSLEKSACGIFAEDYEIVKKVNLPAPK